MTNNRAYLNQSIHPYPHIGQFIRKKLHDLHVSTTEAARRLGISTTSMHAYYKQPSLQFGIIWKLSIALNYDLLSDLMTHYPDSFPIKIDEKKVALEKELEIYKGLLKR